MISIRCCDLAACIGRNRYVPKSQMVLEYVRKMHPRAYANFTKATGEKTKVEEYEMAVEKLDSEMNLAIAKIVSTPPKNDTSEAANEALEVIEKRVAKTDLPASEQAIILDECKKNLYTGYGIRKEAESIEKLASKYDVQEGSFMTKYMTDAYTPDGCMYKVILKGKPDGLIQQKEGVKYILEVKNRTNRFFNTVVDYEYVQVMGYMFLTGISRAKLVEEHNGVQKEHTIVFNEDEWDRIVKGARTYALEILEFVHKWL